MGLILPRRNPLTYPAGVAAGFNPSHPASAGCMFSGVAGGGGNFVNLLTGKPGTVSGAPTATISQYGPGSKFLASTDNNSFPYPSVAWPAQTMAAIVRFDTLSTGNVQVIQATAAGGSSGFYIADAGTGSSSMMATLIGTTFVTFSGVPAFVAGYTYFVAVSVLSASTINCVMMRLDTGQTWSVSQTNSLSFIAGDTTLYIGNRGTNNRMTGGPIFTTMHNTQFMSLPQLLQWTQDPWAFWYPNRPLNRWASLAAAVANFRKTLSLNGTRIGSRQSQGS